uniref:Uncharacterized protein n=1 Tax=Rhizophora mucronata TaxID=61149 RepID=A0A2P2QCG9_RHIMU
MRKTTEIIIAPALVCKEVLIVIRNKFHNKSHLQNEYA